MNKNIIKSATKWFLRSVQFQLYLTLMSMPILAYWGLPVSLASPIGNILFHPLLTIFLFLSSLVFFCQVFHIPNGIFIYALEKTSCSFNYCLGFGSPSWLIGFAKPSLWILIFLPVTTAIILCFKKTRNPYKSILSLLGLFFLFSLSLKFTCKPPSVTQIPCNKGTLTLFTINKQIVLVDPGALGQCISAASWVEFTLGPTIVNMTGKTTIDHLFLLQPSQLSFEALAALCNVITIKNLYMPFWKGEMSRGQKRAYAKLMKAAKNQQTKISRIGHKILIPFNADSICITPQKQFIMSQQMKYPSLELIAHIGNQITTCYSIKMDQTPVNQRHDAIKKVILFAATLSSKCLTKAIISPKKFITGSN
jgi:hypothetical protein